MADDRQVILWDFSTGEVRGKWEAHGSSVTAVSFAEDGKWIVSGGDDKLVKVWDADGKVLAELKGHDRGVRGVSVKPGGRWAASASGDGTVKLWDVAAKKEVATFGKHAVPVNAVTFLPSGVRTLSLDRDLGTLIWDVSKFLGGSAVPA